MSDKVHSSTFSRPVKQLSKSGYLAFRSSLTAGQLKVSVFNEEHQLVPSVARPISDISVWTPYLQRNNGHST